MHDRRLNALLGALVALSVASATSRADDDASSPLRLWDVEVGGGALLFSPNVERIPRGASATAVNALLELSLGRRISRRLELRIAGAYASGSDSEWESESDQGTAVIPTPSIASFFAILEAPLFVGTGRVTPHAGVGVGLLAFSEVDEAIRFDWGTHVTTNRIRFDAHTDPAILFDLGARLSVTERVLLVSRYRLISAFDDEQVNTLDRVTLSARVRW